jgi:hypothetical protein
VSCLLTCEYVCVRTPIFQVGLNRFGTQISLFLYFERYHSSLCAHGRAVVVTPTPWRTSCPTIITKFLGFHKVRRTRTFPSVLPWTRFHLVYPPILTRRAYKRLALQCHPDKNPKDRVAAEIKFKRVNEAYSILHDAKKRKTYEKFGKPGLQYGANINTEDLFASAFASFFKTSFSGSVPRGCNKAPPAPEQRMLYPKGPDIIPYGTNVNVFGLSHAPQHNGKHREFLTG